ncbi:hypothetical protein LCGC14_2852870, partial [marine sediment metagenome]
FDAFTADVGLPTSVRNYTLDRIDNDGNYELGNTRWVSPSAQSRNKRTTKFHELGGERRTLVQWSELAGADYSTVRRRMHYGWPLPEALGTPRNVGRSRKARRTWHPKSMLTAFDDAHERWKLLNEVERTALVDDAIRTYRASGFPWDCLTDRTRDPIDSVRRSRVVVENDVVRKVGTAGQRTCADVHRHRLEARHSGSKYSVVGAFEDDFTLERALRYQLKRGDPITPPRIIRALSALMRGPLNFPPALARWIVDEYAPMNGVVFDPCSGYGGRLLGSLASERHVRYEGADIEPRSAAGNVVLAQRLGVSHRVHQVVRAVEDPTVWPKADVVLLGPPYYDLEDYGAASREQRRAYPTYESWRDGFLRMLVQRSLEVAPVVVINVAANKWNMPDHVR